MVRKSTWRSSGAQTSDRKYPKGASPFDGNWDTFLASRNLVAIALFLICMSHWVQMSRKKQAPGIRCEIHFQTSSLPSWCPEKDLSKLASSHPSKILNPFASNTNSVGTKGRTCNGRCRCWVSWQSLPSSVERPSSRDPPRLPRWHSYIHEGCLGMGSARPGPIGGW